MAADLAAKLRLTAAVLGCADEDELCARFAALNHATDCRPGRLRAWLRGRTVPRSPRLFADWAELVGSDRSGTWIAQCAFDAFADELAILHGSPVADLARRALRGGVAERAPGPPDTHAALPGAFACYSRSWSPAHRGQIIRGALRIHRGQGGALRAVYSETLLGDAMQMAGTVEVTSGTIHMLLRESGSALPVFLALILPPLPASVLCGVMAGPCFVVDHSLPTATRIVAVRVPDSARLEASNRYLPEEADDYCADLAALGLPVGRAPGLDQLIAAFLPIVADQVEPRELAPFQRLLDALPKVLRTS